MTSIRRVAVIDIGKTNAKVALVDVKTLREIAVRKAPNLVLAGPPYPHYDVEALWRLMLDALAAFGREHGVDAISVTTHGATAALLDSAGRLALPVLDYEHTGPDDLTAGYNAVRPDFDETGSPRLPIGLNLGAQLFWQQRMFPEAFARVRTILAYPQYWTWRLSGVAANEATSLGCHTDLWNPRTAAFSSMVARLGWSGLFAPVRPATDRLGPILPAVAEATGLDPETPVFCGIHDSNASLLPHLLARRPPFAVISTGTWVIAMAVSAGAKRLDPSRDTLINVDAFGQPVPSARFMGGREFESIVGEAAEPPSPAEVAAVIETPVLLLPAVQPGSGPFQGREANWHPGKPESASAVRCAASFYLAMMTATCLELAGADGPALVEGPFAGNAQFLQMLAAATGRDVIVASGATTGTSIGAALLALGGRPLEAPPLPPPVRPSGALRPYAAAWRGRVDGP